jgi:hypothetical protein
VRTLGKEYLEDGRSLPQDIKETVAGLGAAGLRDLSLVKALDRLLAGKDPDKVKALMARATELGLG